MFSLNMKQPTLFPTDIIPEDGDDVSHPNVFSIGNVPSPTLGQIRKGFPIPGKYHYRYLKTISNMTVWMDAVDETFIVPPFDGKIFIKACRISESFQQISPEHPPSSRQQEQQQQQTQSRASSGSSRISIPKPPSSSETLLAFGSDDTIEDTQTSFQAVGSGSGSGSFMDSNNDDLIGLSSSDNTIQPLPKPSSSIGLDMFGIDSLQFIPMAQTQPQGLGLGQGLGSAQGSMGMGSSMSSYSSSSMSGQSNQQQHQQQQQQQRMSGMNVNPNASNGGLPLRGISPHPVDAFSGLGSQQLPNGRPNSQPQTRRPY